MMESLAGRTAFITGGAQGIGLGIARELARNGVSLALADVNRTALDAAVTELSSTTDVLAVELDVRDRDRYAQVADEVEARLGDVSLLFNNAGVAGGVPIAELGYDDWDWMLGINLHGVVNGIQTFLPRMIERGGDAHIVNTASGAGLVEAGAGVLYTTSKFAVVGMSESLRSELADRGIGVSVLCPGPVATDIVSNSVSLGPAKDGPVNPHLEQGLDTWSRDSTAPGRSWRRGHRSTSSAVRSWRRSSRTAPTSTPITCSRRSSRPDTRCSSTR